MFPGWFSYAFQHTHEVITTPAGSIENELARLGPDRRKVGAPPAPDRVDGVVQVTPHRVVDIVEPELLDELTRGATARGLPDPSDPRRGGVRIVDADVVLRVEPRRV